MDKELERRRKISKNNARYWLGKKRSQEDKEKMSKAAKRPERLKVALNNLGIYAIKRKPLKRKSGRPKGERHYEWKGGNVGYRGLHRWVNKELGKPDTCEHCGTNGLSGHQIHWANKSGEYKRELTDWLRLCVKCHKEYDKKWLN